MDFSEFEAMFQVRKLEKGTREKKREESEQTNKTMYIPYTCTYNSCRPTETV